MACTGPTTTLSWTTTRPRRSDARVGREPPSRRHHDLLGADIDAYDPFELPDWLGTQKVTFTARAALSETPRVEGMLWSEAGDSFPLDLLAVDSAYPEVVCPDEHRQAAHQAWQFGQVALVVEDGRVAAAVPGTRFDADEACEVIRRLAKSVGAPAGHFTVALCL